MAYVKGKSGTLDFVGTHSFTLRVKWSETYDLEKNTSILSIDGMEMQSLVYGGTYYLGGPSPDYGTLKVNGVLLRTMNYNGNATHAVSVNAGTSWWNVRAINTGYHDDNEFPWVTGEIAHNADGSKKVDLVLNMDLWRSSTTGHRPEWLDVTMSIDLTEIPRASTATVPNFTMGTKGTISISRASSAFTHALSVKLGSSTYQLATGVSASYAWTPAIDTWAPRITNAASASCTMVIDTYNGSTKLGSSESTFTLAVPASVVPSISEFSVELVNDNAAVNGWGIAVKTFTKFEWSVTAAGAQGSTIETYAFTAGSLKGSAATGTTAAVSAAGNVTPSATVTDSRGRTASATGETITVYDYSAPTISRAEIFRCTSDGTEDNSGTYLKLNITSKIADVVGKNSATYHYRSKNVAGSFGGWTAFAPGAVVGGFSSDTSYVVEMRVTDSPGKTASTSITIPTREEWLHGRDGGKGAAFGKTAESDNLLDVAWDLRVRGNLILDNPLPGSGGEGSDIEIPVPVSKGGTGATTAIDALASLFALNLNYITDTDFYVNANDDLNNYLTPGAYRISTSDVSATLINRPPYSSAGGRLIVSATSSSGGLIQVIIFNSTYGQIWYRIRSNSGTWGDWLSLPIRGTSYSGCRYTISSDGYNEWYNPPMVLGTEYRTTERWRNYVVYTKLVDCGTLTNGGTYTYNSSTVYPIRYAARTSAGIALPIFMEPALNSTYKAWVDVNNNKITARFASGYSSLQIYCQIWYTYG